MSDKYYYNKFQQARQEILEALQIEQSAGELIPGTNIVQSNQWIAPTWMDHIVQLYIKYIQILKNLEDCYDQTVYPQMRNTIRKFVENVICRVVQIKKELIHANMPFGDSVAPMMYVFLDDRMIEFKFEPSQFELPIPRYFREDDKSTEKRNILLLERLKLKRSADALPEEDITKFPFKQELNFEAAILIIQNFETGRNNLARIQRALKSGAKYDNDASKKFISEEENRKLAAEFLASVRRVRKNKEEELVFLKMKHEPVSKDNPIDLSKKNRDERKVSQLARSKDYEKLKIDLAQKIKLLEEYDIKEEMKDQRRNWISKVTSENKGVPPYDIAQFYERLTAAKPLELDDTQKKKQEQIAKEKLKKLQDQKKKQEGQGSQGPVKLPVYSGPTEKTKELTKNIEEFKQIYEQPSEFTNNETRFDIAKNEIIGKIEQTIREEVDSAIQMEIINLRSIYYKGKKDPILSKKNRRKGPKPPKEKFLPGENKLANVNIDDLFSDLVMNGILRRMVPKRLDDLICDFNYIAKETMIGSDTMCDIPLFYTKQLVKEYCIFPLGCGEAKKSIVPPMNSILYFGPSGCGKTHAALSVAYHTDALFFDLSPRNIEGKFATKDETTKLVNMVWRVAKAYQPAIIYFDNAEQVYPAKKVRGAVKNKRAELLKRQLGKVKDAITPDMRIMIIGNTNKPHHLDPTLFDKCFYFGLPSFSDRYRIIKNAINKRIGKEYDFEFEVLAEATKSYSTESIISSIDYVLSAQRLEKIKFFPLKIHEFIPVLAKTPVMYEADFIADMDSLYKLTGLKAIHDFLKQNKEENEKASKKKK